MKKGKKAINNNPDFSKYKYSIIGLILGLLIMVTISILNKYELSERIFLSIIVILLFFLGRWIDLRNIKLGLGIIISILSFYTIRFFFERSNIEYGGLIGAFIGLFVAIIIFIIATISSIQDYKSSQKWLLTIGIGFLVLGILFPLLVFIGIVIISIIMIREALKRKGDKD